MRRLPVLAPVAVIIIIAMTTLKAGAGNEGYIYGKITTRSGESFTGTMRWGTQECFWDDLFNAEKDDNPWTKYAEDIDRREIRTNNRFDRMKFVILGVTVTNLGSNHLFITRFGDIKDIESGHRNSTTVVMKNGSEFDVTGYGDVGETIQILDEKLGTVKFEWDEIEKIEFMQTPSSAKVPGYRLKGKLKTDEKDFSGFVMWDAEECISSDILDGSSDNRQMQIEFGNIRSIKRQNFSSCSVTLKDGRDFSLRGTNDVDSDNRGIYVDDERYGKIQVPWDAFVEVTYDDESSNSGRSYHDYKPAEELKGTVEKDDGTTYTGRLVYDFDESLNVEVLNGNLDQMEFNVPFSKIASVSPEGSNRSIVEFINGEKLTLEDAQDVTENNTGLLIFAKDQNKPDYVPWEEIKKVTFSK
ncbi:MAG: hypothetical protein NTW14_13385 [bacterium]|nr:hypothetical protein [bacterium]